MMRLRDRIRYAAGLLTGTYKPWDDFWYDPRATGGSATLSGLTISPDNAMRLSAVQACVRLISGTVAKLPFPIYRRVGQDGRIRDRRHPLDDLLNYQPNAWQSAFEFRRQLTAHVALRGNGYALIRPGRRGFADTLLPLHPDRVRPELVDDDTLVYHVKHADGRTQTYDREMIFHLRDLSLDGVSGLSRIEQAREGIGLAAAAEAHGAAIFGNGASPGVILQTDQRLTQPQREANLAAWEERHRGPFNAGRTAILDAGAKPITVGMTQKDAQYLETRSFQVEDIARLYGLPPHLIGQSEKQTSYGQGVEQMTLGFLAFHVLDWFVMWETAVARDLILNTDRFFAEILVDGLLRADYKTRIDGYRSAIESGQMTPDEARQKENRNPRTDGLGGRFWMPANFRYADESVEEEGVEEELDDEELPEGPALRDDAPARELDPGRSSAFRFARRGERR